MNSLKMDISKALIELHQEQKKEWIPLKEIYERVEKIRDRPNLNGGASIRACLERSCPQSDIFTGDALFLSKEKGTGLYQYLYYENFKAIQQLKKGQPLTKDELMNLFQISGQSGIMKTNKLHCMVLISDRMNRVYQDSDFVNDQMIYTGEGRVGNQTLTKGNKLLYESRKTELPLYLFIKDVNRIYEFVGEVILADDPYQVEEKDHTGQERKVWKFPLYLRDRQRDDSSDRLFLEVKRKMEVVEQAISIPFLSTPLVFDEDPLKLRIYHEKTERTSHSSTKIDYLAQQMIKKQQGDQNEKIVFDYEMKKMEQEGAMEQMKKMKDFFDHRTDQEGYDVLSFERTETGSYREKYIEVKSTKKGESTPIDITKSEVEFARKHQDQYVIYRMIDCDSPNRYVKIISGKELFEQYQLVPTTYQIYAKEVDF